MEKRTWGIFALILSLFVCFVATYTALVNEATVFSRLHTTIIQWQLPLVTMGVIIYSFISEREDSKVNFLAWLAIIPMATAMCLTNLSKNLVQDVASNVDNYVNVSASVIEDESGNVVKYEERLTRAIDYAEKRIEESRVRPGRAVKRDKIATRRKDSKVAVSYPRETPAKAYPSYDYDDYYDYCAIFCK